MRGNTQITQKHCAQCRALTKFQRNSIEWGAGDLIMVLVTFLVWLPLKFAFNAITNPWRCATCGRKP